MPVQVLEQVAIPLACPWREGGSTVAKFYPHVAPPGSGRNSESRVRRILSQALPDKRVHVLQHVRYDSQGETREIDFVLVEPRGIVFIEVKGGNVALSEDGVWTTTDADGRSSVCNPVEQAETASREIRRSLVGAHKMHATTATRWACVFPGTGYVSLGAPLEGRVASGHNLKAQEFSHWYQDLWAGKARGGESGFRPGELEGVVAALLPQLRGPVPLSIVIEESELQAVEETSNVIRLTEAQLKALYSIPNQDRLLIRGGPGTGKTLVALAVAGALLGASRRPLVLFPIGQMKDWVRRARVAESMSGLSGLDLVKEVRAFDKADLVREVAKRSGLNPIGKSASEQEFVDFLERAYASPGWNSNAAWTDLIVDEAQDFTPLEIQALEYLLVDHDSGASRVLICADGEQQLRGLDPWRPPNGFIELPLGINCRNARSTALFVSSALGIDPPVVSASLDPGPPLIVESTDAPRDVSRIVKQALSDAITPGDVAVITVGCRPDAFTAAIRKRFDKQEVAGRIGERDRVCVTGARDFKGRESALTVVALGPGNGREDRLRSPGTSEDEGRYWREALVAMTRPRGQLIVVCDSTLTPALVQAGALKYVWS